MIDALATVTIVASLLAAAYAAVLALRDRPADRASLAGAGVVSLLLVVQVVVAVVLLARGAPQVQETATFMGYVLTAWLLPILAGLLAVAEKSRFGPLVLSVALLAVPVMVVRCQQLWNPAG